MIDLSELKVVILDEADKVWLNINEQFLKFLLTKDECIWAAFSATYSPEIKERIKDRFTNCSEIIISNQTSIQAENEPDVPHTISEYSVSLKDTKNHE